MVSSESDLALLRKGRIPTREESRRAGAPDSPNFLSVEVLLEEPSDDPTEVRELSSLDSVEHRLPSRVT